MQMWREEEEPVLLLDMASFLAAGHTRSAGQMSCAWEYNSCLHGWNYYSSQVQQVFVSSIKLFHKSCVKEL